jgi:hypothetical protein
VTNKAKQLGTAFEHRIVAWAKKLGLKAHRQPGSGAFKGLPHDAVIENILVEAKVRSTAVNQRGEYMLSIDMRWLRRVQEDAIKAKFDYGILVVNAKGDQRPVVLLDFEEYLKLVSEAKN